MDKKLQWKLRDLCDVGTRKMVGYLPQYTIQEHIPSASTAKYLFEMFTQTNGLKMKFFKETIKTTTSSGALYIWDPITLGKFMNDNKPSFKKYGLSNQQQYITFLEHTTVFKEIDPHMYKLIGQTFSDDRFDHIFKMYKQDAKIEDIDDCF